MTAIRQKVAGWIGGDGGAPVTEVIERTHRLLGQAPCALLSATLDDALAVEERPNMPGTVDGWPNWSIALPEPLERLETASLALRVAAALTRQVGGPSASTSKEAFPAPATAPGHRGPAPDRGTADRG
jgi:4-alpha-glucanotransferase